MVWQPHTVHAMAIGRILRWGWRLNRPSSSSILTSFKIIFGHFLAQLMIIFEGKTQTESYWGGGCIPQLQLLCMHCVFFTMSKTVNGQIQNFLKRGEGDHFVIAGFDLLRPTSHKCAKAWWGSDRRKVWSQTRLNRISWHLVIKVSIKLWYSFRIL